MKQLNLIPLKGKTINFILAIPLYAMLLTLMAAPVSGLRAEGMRCNGQLVSEGDTALYEVRSACGDPVNEAHRTEFRTIKSWVNGPCVQAGDRLHCGRAVERTIEVDIDEWIYDFGPHEFIRYLTFENGKLVSIKTGDYGTRR